MPFNGYFLADAIFSMALPDREEMLDRMYQVSVWFTILAIACFIGDFGKFVVFTYIQECLTLRLRKLSFSSLIRQEIGFFDDPRNGSGALAATLAHKTLLISQIIGIQLGNSVGAMLAVVIGIVLGFLGSWRLSLT